MPERAGFALPGLPEGEWSGSTPEAVYAPDTGELTVVAGPVTDWCVDAVGGIRSDNAPVLLHEVEGDVALTARVRVGFADTFDAGGLCAVVSEDRWAKLCFERSPAGERMIVSIVTDGASDDANSAILDSDEVFLRLTRWGDAYVFHYSVDGRYWIFVRQFALRGGARAGLGLFAQSPRGSGCRVDFREVGIRPAPRHDVRDGS